jgi:hypothetical protein
MVAEYLLSQDIASSVTSFGPATRPALGLGRRRALRIAVCGFLFRRRGICRDADKFTFARRRSSAPSCTEDFCSVNDVFTGWPAVWDRWTLNYLIPLEVARLVDLLNGEDPLRRGCIKVAA